MTAVDPRTATTVAVTRTLPRRPSFVRRVPYRVHERFGVKPYVVSLRPITLVSVAPGKRESGLSVFPFGLPPCLSIPIQCRALDWKSRLVSYAAGIIFFVLQYCPGRGSDLGFRA